MLSLTVASYQRSTLTILKALKPNSMRRDVSEGSETNVSEQMTPEGLRERIKTLRSEMQTFQDELKSIQDKRLMIQDEKLKLQRQLGEKVEYDHAETLSNQYWEEAKQRLREETELVKAN